MNTDQQLQQDVTAQLDWNPAINAAQVGVDVHQGIVTLAGHVGTLAEKWAAEQLVLRLTGTPARSEALDVQLPGSGQRSDGALVRAVEYALAWQTVVPAGRLAVTVDGGFVQLTGDVDWQYQRLAAEQIVRNLTGVRGVDNAIAIKPAVALSAVKHDIEGALLRCARRDSAHRVDIRLQNDEVTLSGFVSTWDERVSAIDAAWSAPGVRNVVDEMQMRL
ncbi:BON domain-containing protein [Duganella sp. S19_KUP01_CR8]|uniref:BON domain-containing protein n=1 Tax=Duganella sp. S19_KUP01_CR8 TaxID=3025502 RepID=UPI002FCD8FEB